MFEKRGLIDELSDYIKKNLKKGYTKESLKWALINQGYSRIEIEKAISRVDEILSKEAPVLKTKPEITYHYEAAGERKENLGNSKESFWKKWF